MKITQSGAPCSTSERMISSDIAAHLFVSVQSFLAEHVQQPFIEPLDLSDVEEVLDIACGSGGWVLHAARTHRDIDFVGIDNDMEIVSYARAQARVQGLDNALFQVADMQRMTLIEDDSFDVIHVRFIKELAVSSAWPELIREFRRVCRQGGHIMWTESGYPITTSPACQQWLQIVQQALKKAGRMHTITNIMHALLSHYGWENITKIDTPIDLSVETEAYSTLFHHSEHLLNIFCPFLTRMGMASADELECLRQQMLMEIAQEDFCAVWSLTTVVGNKAN